MKLKIKDHFQKKTNLVVNQILNLIKQMSLPKEIGEGIKIKIQRLQTYTNNKIYMHQQIRQCFVIEAALAYSKCKTFEIKQKLLVGMKTVIEKIKKQNQQSISLGLLQLKLINNLLIYQLCLKLILEDMTDFISLGQIIQDYELWQKLFQFTPQVTIYGIVAIVIKNLQQNQILFAQNLISVIKNYFLLEVFKQDKKNYQKWSRKTIEIIFRLIQSSKILKEKFFKKRQSKKSSIQKAQEYFFLKKQKQENTQFIKDSYLEIKTKNTNQQIIQSLIFNFKQVIKQFNLSCLSANIYDFSKSLSFQKYKKERFQLKIAPQNKKETSLKKLRNLSLGNRLEKGFFLSNKQVSHLKTQQKHLSVDNKKEIIKNKPKLESIVLKQINKIKYQNSFYIDLVMCKRYQQPPFNEPKQKKKEFKSLSTKKSIVNLQKIKNQGEKKENQILIKKKEQQFTKRTSIVSTQKRKSGLLKIQIIRKGTQTILENIIQQNHVINRQNIFPYFKGFLIFEGYLIKKKNQWPLYQIIKSLKIGDQLYYKTKILKIKQLHIDLPFVNLGLLINTQYQKVKFDLKNIAEFSQIFLRFEGQKQNGLYFLQNLGGIISVYKIVCLVNEEINSYQKIQIQSLSMEKYQIYFRLNYKLSKNKQKIKCIKMASDYFYQLNHEDSIRSEVKDPENQEFNVREKFRPLKLFENIFFQQYKLFISFFTFKFCKIQEKFRSVVKVNNGFQYFDVQRVKCLIKDNHFILIKSVKGFKTCRVRLVMKIPINIQLKLYQILNKCYNFDNFRKKLEEIPLCNNLKWNDTIIHQSLFTSLSFTFIKIIQKKYYVIKIIYLKQSKNVIIIIQNKSKLYYGILNANQILPKKNNKKQVDNPKNRRQASIKRHSSIKKIQIQLQYLTQQKNEFKNLKKIKDIIIHQSRILLRENSVEFYLKKIIVSFFNINYYWIDLIFSRKYFCLRQKNNIIIFSEKNSLMFTNFIRISSLQTKQNTYEKLNLKLKAKNYEFVYYSEYMRSIVLVRLNSNKYQTVVKLLSQYYAEDEEIQISTKNMIILQSNPFTITKKHLQHPKIRLRFIKYFDYCIIEYFTQKHHKKQFKKLFD